MAPVSGERVLVVSSDERWLRVLEVTLRLGGFTPVPRRSVMEALRVPAHERAPSLVLDLGADLTLGELTAVREALGESETSAVVILPERLGGQREAFSSAGASVLVRPYRPSALYAALRQRTGVARQSA